MDKEGLLLLCSNFPCFKDVDEQHTDYRLQTEARLVVVVVQHFTHNLFVVPLTTSPGALRIPISVAIPQVPWYPDALTLVGDPEALSEASYVNLAQLTSLQWGCRMLNADVHLLMNPQPGKRARLPSAELHKLRSMLAIHMLKLGHLGGFGGLGSGYGGPGQGYGGPAQGYRGPGQGYGDPAQGYGGPGQGYEGPGQGYGGPGQGYGGHPYREGPTAPADMHNRALLARDEDPFKSMLLSFEVPYATPEQMASVIYADPFNSPKVPPSNL